MNDDAASKLTTLRKQLETSQMAHAGQDHRSSLETRALVKLIVHLSQICRSHNRDLDNRLVTLRAHINRNAAVGEYLDELKHLERTIWEYLHKFYANLRKLNDWVTTAGQTLLKATALPALSDLRRVATIDPGV